MTKTISNAEIKRIHEEFVLRNTLLNVIKVAELLSCSARKVYRLIESGDLEEANDTPGKQGTRVSAWSVEQYRVMCVNLAATHRKTG